MLLELFILFEIITIGVFFASFYSRQEILWAISAVFSGFMMATSYTIEIATFQYNTTLGAYQPINILYYYPYLMGINLVFLVLSIILGVFDLWDKYGQRFAGGKSGPSR